MGEHSRPRGRHEGQAQRVSKTGLALVIIVALAICALLGTTGTIVSNMVSDTRPAAGIIVHEKTILPPVLPARVPAVHRKVSPRQAVRLYAVRAGDCLWTIAARRLGNDMAWKAIARANDLHAPWTIYPGQELKL